MWVEEQDAGAVLPLKARLQHVHGEAIAVGYEAGAYAVRQGDRLESHRLSLSVARRGRRVVCPVGTNDGRLALLTQARLPLPG